MNDISIKVSLSSRPDKAVQIRFDNAINYPTEDFHYFVADTQPHLKLRILNSAVAGKPEGRSFYYDYYWQGKRIRHLLGQISKDNKSGITPPKARELVIGYEALRKQGKHPLQGQQKSIKEISLNSHFAVWKEDADIKPNVARDGTRDGLDPKFYNQQVSRYNRHIKDTIGHLPLTTLTTAQIKKWFDNIRKETKTESLKCLNLAKQIVNHLLKYNEELAEVLPNRFSKVDQKKLNTELANKRELQAVALEPEEFRALWKACDEWHNEVEGLYIKFVMASALRGINVATLKLDEIVKKNGRYQVRKVMKKTLNTVRFTPTMEEIYKEVLKARKKYPQPETGYLFPKYQYNQQREVINVAHVPMSNDNIDRIYKGKNKKEKQRTVNGVRIRETLKVLNSGGIRGIAQNTEPTVGKYGLHDIRNTYSTICDTEEERAVILGHSIGTTANKHYTQKDSRYFDKFADKREEIFLKLIK